MREERKIVWCNGRMILLWIIGFFMGRVWLMSINPFGLSLVAATADVKKGYQGVAICVMLGMFTSMDGLSLVKYLLLFSVVKKKKYKNMSFVRKEKGNV